jgi:CheY-like chemotaxis protein
MRLWRVLSFHVLKREKPNVPALLGQVVKVRRQKLGFSQEEHVWRAGLNSTYVTEVERGARNLSLNTIDRLASALQTPLSALLHDVDKARGAVRGVELAEAAQVDILLVEDNARDAELTMKALRRARLANSVHLARDGAEALDYLFCTGPQKHRKLEDSPHLVLLDLKLPRVDGLEVLRCLKSDSRTRALPVVVLTVSEDSKDMAEARRLGAETYIVKPVDFQRLAKVTPDLNFSWNLQRQPSLPSESRTDNVTGMQ